VTAALGALGIAGGVSYLACGIRILAFGGGEDRVTDVLGILWALAWAGGGWAMLTLRVTGPSRAGRAVSAVLVAGFIAAALWGLHRLIDRTGANAGPFAVAPLVVILGMLGTGVLAFSEAPWSLWRRSLPLVMALVYILCIVWSGLTAQVTLGYAFTITGVGYILLGDTLRRHAVQRPSR